MSALQACLDELAAAARRSRRQRIRLAARHYNRARHLGDLLPPLTDYPPPDPHFDNPGSRILPAFRTLNARWLRDDAATTRQIMRFIVGSLSFALWKRANGGDAETRIHNLRAALLAEATRYFQQRARELFAPAAAEHRHG